MPDIPPPPVPQFLRETLKDYPALIQKIQEELDDVVARPFRSTPPFEQAIWALEGILGVMWEEAHEALQAAKQTGDSLLIYRAKIKYDALVDARRGPSLDELRDYFQTYKGAFE